MLLDHPFRTVTPTVDGDVLAVLAGAEARFTTGQLRRMIGRYSEQGIRKVLARLVDQGVVRSERVGNAYGYELNRDHVCADPIILLARSRQVFFGRLTDLIAGWQQQPAFAAVYGSAARGEMREASDIDILIVHRDGESTLDWDARVLDIMLRVPQWTGNRAEVVLMHEGELVELAHEPMLASVRAIGVAVGGDRRWFESRLRQALGRGRRAHA